MRRLARAALVLPLAMLLLAGPGRLDVLGSGPPPARADGDPASDVLLGQSAFLPYSPVSPGSQRRLYAVLAAAARAGYPVRVALIGAPGDLGVVPALFGRPAAYARFLSAELGDAVPGPVLVVMPQGFGLAREGRGASTAALTGLAAGRDADGMATSAVAAVTRLARAAGRPLPANAASAAGGAGAPAATVRRALTAIAVLAVLAALGGTAAFAARRRRAGLHP